MFRSAVLAWIQFKWAFKDTKSLQPTPSSQTHISLSPQPPHYFYIVQELHMYNFAGSGSEWHEN